MTRKRLEGYRALVSGASSGIGAELARQLAARGADLVITARRRSRLETLAQELEAGQGVEVRIIELDLGQPDAAAALFEQTEGAGIAVDVLINNAGFGDYDLFVEIPWERHAAMLQLNLVALTQLTRLFVPRMIERGRGHVMNVASIGAYTPTPNFAVYGASKAYVRNFSEALDYELRGTGVRAIVVSPGATRTEFSDAANQKITRSGELVMMSAERCARIALEKMLRGRRGVVTGTLNAVGMWLLRMVPRRALPAVAYRMLSAGAETGPRALPERAEGDTGSDRDESAD